MALIKYSRIDITNYRDLCCDLPNLLSGLEIKKKFKSPFGDYQRKKVAKCKNAVAR